MTEQQCVKCGSTIEEVLFNQFEAKYPKLFTHDSARWWCPCCAKFVKSKHEAGR